LENFIVMKRKRTELIESDICIKNLNDLINFAWKCDKTHSYWYVLWKSIKPLEELQNMIGMEKLKQQIVSMILYYIGEFNIIRDSSNNVLDITSEEMMHIALYGPPGCGKTTIINVIANIFYSLGCIKSKNVVRVKKSDLISEHIGGSEANTKRIFEKVIKNNSILLIDEAYSLGSRQVDSFSKAIIDLINQYLSEHGKDFICIIAGYKNDIKNNFFSINKGLERRFPWQFEIPPYTSKELYDMFLHKVAKEHWKIEDNIISMEDFNINKFPNSGGDIDTLFLMCKMIHIRRVFGKHQSLHKIINKNDFKRAHDSFIERTKEESGSYQSMFI
jgi:SpoVK/Ycf46/Vps4 family AAA+-type ATPase